MPDRPFEMLFDENMKKAAEAVGPTRLAAAFREQPFVYGTTGDGSIAGKAVRLLMGDKAFENSPNLTFYDPGPRLGALQGKQMMDYYYGQEGTHLHAMRNPVVGEYVHIAMGFKGKYDHSVPGWKAYKNTYNVPPHDGWAWPVWGDPSSGLFFRPNKEAPGGKEPLKGTVYMSWVIQNGVAEYGGQLIFEGKGVYYGQVFCEGATIRRGDTDIEAMNLFTYFRPGYSRAQFKNGLVIFHWNGVEAIPTHFKFQENWQWSGGVLHTHKNWRTQAQRETDVLKPIWNNFDSFVKQDRFSEFTEQLLQNDQDIENIFVFSDQGQKLLKERKAQMTTIRDANADQAAKEAAALKRIQGSIKVKGFLQAAKNRAHARKEAAAQLHPNLDAQLQGQGPPPVPKGDALTQKRLEFLLMQGIAAEQLEIAGGMLLTNFRSA